MKIGSRGQEVVELQKLINAAGLSKIAVDGVFGAETDSAVRKFQNAAKLRVDGIAGAATVAALKASGKSSTAPMMARSSELELSKASATKVDPSRDTAITTQASVSEGLSPVAKAAIGVGVLYGLSKLLR
jgi:peptidoglycan hydrolase-like protein with peptidoglycan-binding domain